MVELLWMGAFLKQSCFMKQFIIFAVKASGQRYCAGSQWNEVRSQSVPLLNPNTAFKLTAITKGIENYQKHLSRFIA
jgi:hypothetical protein